MSDKNSITIISISTSVDHSTKGIVNNVDIWVCITAKYLIIAVKKYNNKNNSINLKYADATLCENLGLVLNKTLSPGCEFLIVRLIENYLLLLI